MIPPPSREEIAKAEIGRTEVSNRLARLLTLLFLLTLFGIPVWQAFWELRQHVGLPQACDILGMITRPSVVFADGRSSLITRIFAANRVLQQEIGRYDERLENESKLTRFVLPSTQRVLSGWLGAGNEKTYCGKNGWLFYRPAVEYLTGRRFLEAGQLARRRQLDDVQPDPRTAILHFHQQLRRRGIQLVVMPVAVKPMVHPEKLTARFRHHGKVLQNPSYVPFVRDVENAGIPVFETGDLLMEMRQEQDRELFLRTDTHWRPETMEYVAESLASFLTDRGLLSSAIAPTLYRRERSTIQNLGDIAAMLQLPPDQTIYPPEEVRISRVMTQQDMPWRPSQDSDVLLLGDSFSNVYSLAAMGWGEAAGFAEQLSFALQRPVDCILRNDDGAYATREILTTELARGHDRLESKRVVIYQFAVRELAVGNWKLLDLELGTVAPSTFFCPPPGNQVTVSATVASMSSVPKPGSVPYKDHIVALHAIGLEPAEERRNLGQAVVYMWSMRNNVWTEAAEYSPGQTIRLLLRPWADVSHEMDRINRSELDGELLLQEPCWGEPAP